MIGKGSPKAQTTLAYSVHTIVFVVPEGDKVNNVGVLHFCQLLKNFNQPLLHKQKNSLACLAMANIFKKKNIYIYFFANEAYMCACTYNTLLPLASFLLE